MSEIPEAVPNQIPDSLSDEQRQELRQLAENVNSRLFQAGAESAEQAFGLGCVVFALPVLILIAVLFFVQVLNLILALIVLAMGAVVVAGLVALLAHSARARTIHNLYLHDIEPEINRCLSKHAASRSQFDQVAHQTLSVDAPLRPYLTLPLEDNILKEEEYK